MLDVGIRNLVESNKADILASPSVVTVDGQKASIALTTNIKYISERDEAGNPVYTEERIGPTLEFTPIVGRDNTVTKMCIRDRQWSRSYSFPLLRGIEVVNVEGGLELRLFTNELLEVKEIKGTEPAPLYRLQLGPVASKPVEEPAKEPEERLPLSLKTGPKDPMAIASPVTLELRDTELKDVLRMLAKFMGINVIIDPSVPPTTITLSVKDAPLREVLAYIMRMNNLNYAMMGNTILFGTPENLAKSLGMEQTKSFKIAYADPKQIPSILQSLVGVTTVAVDERLRTVYVTGRPDNLHDVEQLLQRIDHPGRQVMLQARLIEVRDTGRKELESIVDAVYKHWWFSYGAGGGSIGYVDSSEPGTFDPDDDRPTSPLDVDPVSYTHLDVYKRQFYFLFRNRRSWFVHYKNFRILRDSFNYFNHLLLCNGQIFYHRSGININPIAVY